MKRKIYKISLLTLLASTVMYSSCDKSKLDLLPNGPTESNYFKSEADFNRSAIGVYAKLTDFMQYAGGGYIGGAFFLTGDDITTNSTNEDVEVFASLQPSNGKSAKLWGTCYQLIARANVLIEKVDAAPDNLFASKAAKDSYKGEALFLRGYANYLLWNFFATAPLRNSRVASEADFKPSNSKNNELLDQAIKDFELSATLLPSTVNAASKGRVFKNSAYGFLGKCLVFRGSATKNTTDFTSANAAFNKITNTSDLVSDFGNNFSDKDENNKESLFEIQAGNASGGNNVWLSNDFDNPIGDLSIYWGYYSNDWSLFGASRYLATTKLAAAFEGGDPRLAETLNDDKTVAKYAKQDQSGGSPGSYDNYRVLRMADVKLLQAEAILQSGGSTATAIEKINEVRSRARGAGTVPANYSIAETNKTTIMNWIMNERFIELAGEGQRWFDLRRWHMQGLITLNSAFFSSNVTVNFVAPKNLNFPIPLSELDVNPNMKQNTSY